MQPQNHQLSTDDDWGFYAFKMYLYIHKHRQKKKVLTQKTSQIKGNLNNLASLISQNAMKQVGVCSEIVLVPYVSDYQNQFTI